MRQKTKKSKKCAIIFNEKDHVKDDNSSPAWFPGTILEILIKKFAKNIFKSIFLQTKVLF